MFHCTCEITFLHRRKTHSTYAFSVTVLLQVCMNQLTGKSQDENITECNTHTQQVFLPNCCVHCLSEYKNTPRVCPVAVFGLC